MSASRSPDLDAAIKWYHDHLGMIVLHEEVNEDQGIREAMLSVRGAPVGSAQIQLMAPLDETSTIAKFLDKRGPGLQQLAYRVSDLDALSERLREQGVRLLYDAPRRGTANSRINFIHPKDAGGVLIELVEPASDTRTSSLRPLARRAPRCPVRPARRVPMPPVIGRAAHPYRRATPPNGLCQAGFRDHSRGSGRSWSPATPRSAAPRIRSRPVRSRSGEPQATAARERCCRGGFRRRGMSTWPLRTAGTRRCPCRASGRSPKSRNGSRDRSPVFGPAA